MGIFNSGVKRSINSSFNGKPCGICGKAATKKMTVDHIIAKSKGGSNKSHNLQPAHKLCNRLKGNK